MSFFDWMNMNMIIDIAFLVTFSAVVWKLRTMERRLMELREDLTVVMRNPQAAKRLLKERK
jgi:hypothetical protein